MIRNVGGIDRILRITVGLVLIVLFFASPGAEWRWLYLVGIVPLLTGLMGTCPAYSIFGMTTCRLSR